MKRILRAGERYALFRKRRTTNTTFIYSSGRHSGSLHYFIDTQRVIGMLLPVALFLFLSPVFPALATSGLTSAPTDSIRPLQIGDTVPGYLWSLPLQVTNHPTVGGRETITLAEYRGETILLDFLS